MLLIDAALKLISSKIKHVGCVLLICKQTIVMTQFKIIIHKPLTLSYNNITWSESATEFSKRMVALLRRYDNLASSTCDNYITTQLRYDEYYTITMASSDKFVAICRSKHIVLRSSCWGSAKFVMKFSPNCSIPVDLLVQYMQYHLQDCYVL